MNTDSLINSELSRIRQGQHVADRRVHIAIPDAKQLLQRGLAYFVGSDYQWLPEYDAVASWLTDNRGRGLLCMGNCGRGKSVITQKILPILFLHYHSLVVNTLTAIELNEQFDQVKGYKILGIDDIGTEAESVRFGEHRLFFNEIVDLAERKEKLLILSTNLDGSELEARYGVRTIDRLRAITTQIAFPGESLRK